MLRPPTIQPKSGQGQGSAGLEPERRHDPGAGRLARPANRRSRRSRRRCARSRSRPSTSRPSFLEAVADGEAAFAIDQQQFLQGYLPVVFLSMYAKYGLHPGRRCSLRPEPDHPGQGRSRWSSCPPRASAEPEPAGRRRRRPDHHQANIAREQSPMATGRHAADERLKARLAHRQAHEAARTRRARRPDPRDRVFRASPPIR